jgi:hypothetical protein
MKFGPLPIVGVEFGARMENTVISVTKRTYVPTAVAMSAWAAERFLRKEDSVSVGALGAA